MENKEKYWYTFSEDHRLWIGLLASVHSTVEVHPCWGILVDWVAITQADKEGGGRCSGWRGPGPCSIWAKQGTSLQHTELSCITHWAYLYILVGRMEPLASDFFSVRHTNNVILDRGSYLSNQIKYIFFDRHTYISHLHTVHKLNPNLLQIECFQKCKLR